MQKGVGKSWAQIHKEHLWEDEEEWRRLCHKVSYFVGNVNGCCMVT